MKYDCLIIDDEKELADNTCDYLNMFNISSYVCYSKEDYINFFKDNNASLILLDINLKDGSGFDICKEISNGFNDNNSSIYNRNIFNRYNINVIKNKKSRTS